MLGLLVENTYDGVHGDD